MTPTQSDLDKAHAIAMSVMSWNIKDANAKTLEYRIAKAISDERERCAEIAKAEVGCCLTEIYPLISNMTGLDYKNKAISVIPDKVSQAILKGE